jgi:glycosyltransferase involved in cell wall biosynthesis
MPNNQRIGATIVIPVFNRENILEMTLKSVREQTYPYYSCVIVDDHSTDGTVALARKFQDADDRFLVFENPVNKGACHCRNLGLSLAQTEHIVFLDSDDIWLPHFLETMLGAIRQNVGYYAAACQALVFEKEIGDSKGIRFAGVSSPINLEKYLLEEVAWNTSCMLWKTEAIRALGGFAEHLKMWQDWDLNVRFLGAGGKVLPVPTNLLYSKVGGHSQITNQIQGRIRVMQQFFARENSWKAIRSCQLSQCALNFFASDFQLLAAVLLAYREFTLSWFSLKLAVGIKKPPESIYKFIIEYLKRTRLQFIFQDKPINIKKIDS